MMLEREKVARNGIELEGLILDLNGNPVSASDEILSKLSDPDGFKEEVDKSTIEIVTSPHLTVLNSARELIDQAGKLEETMQGLGYLFLPIDTAISSFVPDVRDTSRYTPQKLILGDERFSLCGRVNGTHIHFSQEPDKIPEQVNYILAADPAAIALTSSSPLNGVHNWRLHTYRNIVYQSFPFQGHLQNLKPSYDAYLDELDRGFREFQRKARKRGVELNDSFDMFNSIWGPTKLNQNLGTVEAGFNPLHL
jgi:gamma-glutamyl:cysteine ligase YbdK (ATP-grasp superfamily)